MSLIKKFIFAIIAVSAVLTIVSFFLPGKWTIERSVVIDAPPEKIFPYLNVSKNWQLWTPWNRDIDPSLTYHYEGPDQGEGSVQIWTGQNTVTGSIVLKSGQPDSGVTYNLSIGDGSLDVRGELVFEAEGKGTRVYWREFGDAGLNPLKRLFASGLDDRVGQQFEKGLKKLKKVVEANL